MISCELNALWRRFEVPLMYAALKRIFLFSLTDSSGSLEADISSAAAGSVLLVSNKDSCCL